MEKSKHSNREKRVDTSLSVAATADLIKYQDLAGKNKAIIFFTGKFQFLQIYTVVMNNDINVYMSR